MSLSSWNERNGGKVVAGAEIFSRRYFLVGRWSFPLSKCVMINCINRNPMKWVV